MADEQPRNYQIKLTLEKFAVLDDRDPGWLGPGEIHFTCHVTAGADQRRVQVTLLPSVGVFKMHPGEQVLERVIFEGPVHSGESLEIRVTGVEEDFLGSPDQFELYSRRCRGDPLSWNGSYQPGD